MSSLVIQAIRTEPVADGTHEHVVEVMLEDGTLVKAAKVQKQIEAKEERYLIHPPPGWDARARYEETNRKPTLKVRECPECGKPVLTA